VKYTFPYTRLSDAEAMLGEIKAARETFMAWHIVKCDNDVGIRELISEGVYDPKQEQQPAAQKGI